MLTSHIVPTTPGLLNNIIEGLSEGCTRDVIELARSWLDESGGLLLVGGTGSSGNTTELVGEGASFHLERHVS